MKTEFKILKQQDGVTLNTFLSQSLKLSGRQTKRLLDNRTVFVNGRRVWMAKHRLKYGDIIEVPEIQNTKKKTAKIQILYQDVHCLVANKPAGMLANGERSCESILQEQIDNKQLKAVHRLDKDTSGCLLFSKTKHSSDQLISQFKDHSIIKQYTALVKGLLTKRENNISTSIDGFSAGTSYKMVTGNEVASYVHVRISTGKTHQIRKHFDTIGHPVLGDKKYGSQKIKEAHLRQIPRQMLHASGLSFVSLDCDREVRVKAPEPQDFRKFRALLTNKKNALHS